MLRVIVMSFEENSYDIEKEKLPYQMKLKLWHTAFGLQEVDRLKPSEYMYELADKNAQGKIDYEAIYENITTYYGKENISQKTKEADIVSLRITELLSRSGFTFSPVMLLSIHKQLFKDIFETMIPIGKFRTYNIKKKEPVLNGKSVIYTDYSMLSDALNYDFETEKKIHYNGLSSEEKAKHIMKFISDIWQIHPFGEGNTRTIAVFAIKYLQTKNFQVNNQMFEKYSAYFRNSLVLANYLDVQTNQFLDKFTENLLLGGKNELL
ncbi:MAG: Fic family protein, partial [Lactobacillales bacterium]|nr:Fic family protein [Lactobacillales bacterium]